ncbi:UNVERIFIED_CONTAM: hypothetical protein HDU68_001414, partial [Siphonaria sp. JEL0065]
KWKRGRILLGLERAPSTATKKNKKISILPTTTAATTIPSLTTNKRRASAANLDYPNTLSKQQRILSCPDSMDAEPRLTYSPASFSNQQQQQQMPLRRSRTASSSSFSLFAPAVSATISAAAQEQRGQMLLKSAFDKSPILGPESSKPEEVQRRNSISSPLELTGSPLRSAFICAALETLENNDSLRLVADAVRFIRRKSQPDAFSPLPPPAEEEIEMDVGLLNPSDWEYLCGVLVSV